MKMKTDFFNISIFTLLIVLIISWMTSSLVYAAEGDEDINGLPDLIIEDISFDPVNPEPEQSVNITATVKNQGTVASGVTSLVCYINGKNIGEGEVPQIEAGENYKITFQWKSETESSVEVNVKVDEENSITETDEGNNEKTETLTIKKEELPDLIIENLSFNPENPAQGQQVTITATVKNQGTVASGLTYLTYYVNEVYAGKSEISGIGAGEEDQVQFSWNSGNENTVEITAKADEENSVKESNENNNQIKKTLTLKSVEGSDLIIEDLSFNPTNPEVGQLINITATVKNQGTVASGATNLAFYSNETSIGERDVQPIEAGQSEQIFISWQPEAEGLVRVTVKADERNSVLETNEDNNERTTTLTVTGSSLPGPLLPDLVIDDIVPELSEPQVGRLLNITLRIRNQGTAPSETVIAKYYISGTEGPDIQIPPLSVENGVDIVFSSTPDKEGPMEVRGVVDFGGVLNESDDTNNELTKIINVVPVPTVVLPSDLTIESLSINPTSPEPGENVTFTAGIKNNGLGPSSSTMLTYNISGTNGSYGELSIPPLAAGETIKRTFFWNSAVEEQIEVTLVIDSENAVSESGETNNKLTKTIKIAKKTTSSGSSGSSSSSKSSSGGMGSGVSAEPAKNIAAKELVTRNVISGYHMKYEFVENRTCIEYIEYDAKRTFKRTKTTVEVLKNNSTLVSSLPPGRIYKHVNIWVGETGAGLPDAIDNGIVGFRVEKAWIINNNVNESKVILQWYYNKTWQLLSTEKVREDQNYVYFKAKTPGYSSFAVTEYKGIEENKEDNNTQVEENKTQIGAPIQEVLGSWKGEEKAVLNVSAEEKETQAKKPTGKAKIIMAISLPLLMILVEFFVLKKKL